MPADLPDDPEALAARLDEVQRRIDAVAAQVRRWRPCRRCWAALVPAGDDDHEGCEAVTRTPTATPRGAPPMGRPTPWRPT